MENDGIKCFLIDDDPDDCEIFLMALEDIDYPVESTFAADGVDALKKLADTAYIPDCIFLDVNLPKMNGVTCLKELLKIDHLKNTPVYMFSTSNDPHIVQETIELGAAGFILKPNTISELSNRLKEVLQHVKLPHTNQAILDKTDEYLAKHPALFNSNNLFHPQFLYRI